MIEKCTFCGEKKNVLEGQYGFICSDCCEMFHQTFQDCKTDNKSIDALIPTPLELKKKLDEYVVGQEEAKRIISVAVCNHLKRIHMKNNVIEKSNILLIGPTGCGKTHLMSTVSSILNLPMITVDSTNFTQVGYVGKDASSILQELYIKSDCDMEKCQQGIVYVDEIDKLVVKKSAHDEKDINGTGVQQNFLKMMEGGVHTFKMTGIQGPYDISIDTSNILFVFGGSFVGLRNEPKAETRHIGFMAAAASTNSIPQIKEIDHDDIIKYGFIPEFVGRIPVIVSMNELSRKDLHDILTKTPRSIINQYQKLFAMDNISLSFDDALLDDIVDSVLQKKTGARGLKGLLEKNMMEVMFEASLHNNVKKIIIDKKSLSKPKLAFEAETVAMTNEG